MHLPLFVARLRFILRVCLYCMRDLVACLWFVCVCCMIVLRVVLCAFVFLTCKFAFHITRVCRSHLRFPFVVLVWLFVLV